MMKISYSAIAIGTVAIIGFIYAMRATTPEDAWVCSNGQWVKHGNPTDPKPTKMCRLPPKVQK